MMPYILLSPVFQPIWAVNALLYTDSRHYVGESAGRYRYRSSSFVPFAATVTEPGPSVHDDQNTVSAMAGGDERAAARLYDKYSAIMFALAVRIVGDGTDAEDVILDVFTQAWTKASAYDASRGSVVGWLTTMTRTRALDNVRSRIRRAKAVDTASRAMGDDPIAVAGAAVSASDRVELGERAEALNKAMSTLSAPQRSAIDLAFFGGLTHIEISERLGEPLGTIKTRIRLGMQKLRDVLRDLSQELVS